MSARRGAEPVFCDCYVSKNTTLDRFVSLPKCNIDICATYNFVNVVPSVGLDSQVNCTKNSLVIAVTHVHRRVGDSLVVDLKPVVSVAKAGVQAVCCMGPKIVITIPQIDLVIDPVYLQFVAATRSVPTTLMIGSHSIFSLMVLLTGAKASADFLVNVL
ncbi:hypothetical protein [Falsiruegeria litorea]|uniref:hypothetical protein n=1 Tax=Falsiruegeria litorea TaxID=1280831 RepID=UPI0013FE2533|nr:hypothetical protein [Falsiruegeria litorea]